MQGARARARAAACKILNLKFLPMHRRAEIWRREESGGPGGGEGGLVISRWMLLEGCPFSRGGGEGGGGGLMCPFLNDLRKCLCVCPPYG